MTIKYDNTTISNNDNNHCIDDDINNNNKNKNNKNNNNNKVNDEKIIIGSITIIKKQFRYNTNRNINAHKIYCSNNSKNLE